MPKIIILFFALIIIEFNLQWLNNTNMPNWVKCWDNNGNEMEFNNTIEYTESGWTWEATRLDGSLITRIGIIYQ